MRRHLDLTRAGLIDESLERQLERLKTIGVERLDDDRLSEISMTLDEIDRLHSAYRPAKSGVAVRSTFQVSGADVRGHSPAVGMGSAGDLWFAWLEYHDGVGDQVRITSVSPHDVVESSRKTWELRTGDAIRPTIATSRDGHPAWLLYGELSEGRTSVRARPLLAGDDSVGQLISGDSTPTFNQDGAIGPDGDLHVVYQSGARGTFSIVYQRRDQRGWSPPKSISGTQQNAWDPSICIKVNGQAVAVWSAFRGGRYRLFLGQGDNDRWAVAEVPTLPGQHALHPSVQASLDGEVYIAYDSLSVPDHGSSGDTAFRPTSAVDDSLSRYDPTARERVHCQVDLVTFDGTGFHRWSGLESTKHLSAATYPVLATSEDGSVWLSYRTRRALPFTTYLTDAVVRRLHEGKLSSPFVIPMTDGPYSEMGLVGVDGGVALVAQSEGHRDRYAALVDDFHSGDTALVVDSEQAIREHLGLRSGDALFQGNHLHTGAIRSSLIACEDDTDAVSTSSNRDVARVDDLDESASASITEVSLDEETGRTLYWGDLHRHSNISRCSAGLDLEHGDQFRFSEDVLDLDFWALTDHAEGTSDFSWAWLQKLANIYYRSGHHVPFVGFEWTSFAYGHMNVIYPGSSGPIYSANDPNVDTPEKLWAELSEVDALTIPHHPAALRYPTAWPDTPQQHLRVAEVFQAATGSYESDWCHRQYFDAVAPGSTIQNGLEKGHRIGLIGSTDHRYGVTYVGVFAERLTRNAVFEALENRHCFASTRRGLQPRLTIGSEIMGSEVKLADVSPHMLRYGGRGVTELSRVQLVRDGEVVHQAESPDPRAGTRLPIDIRVRSPQGGPRLIEGALSVGGSGRIESTTFVHPALTQISEDRCEWAQSLPQKYAEVDSPPGVLTLGVTVVAPSDEEITLVIDGLEEKFLLSEIATGAVQRAITPEGLTLDVKLGIGGLDGLGVSEITLVAPASLLQSGSWYYTRVIQVDGEVAWSSPIWID